MLNILPGKVELAKREVIQGTHNLLCLFCSHDIEDIDHLFFNCEKSKFIWRRTCEWLVVEIDLEEEMRLNYVRELNSKPTLKFRLNLNWLFGLAICWIIWSCRKTILFNEGILNKFDMIGMIKFFFLEMTCGFQQV